MELGFDDYGEGSLDTDTSFGNLHEKASASATLLGVKKMEQITDKLSAYARLGVASWEMDLETYYPDYYDATYTWNESGTGYYWGMGVAYNLTANLLLSANYSFTQIKPDMFERIDPDSYSGSKKPYSLDAAPYDGSINNYSIGIAYQF